MDNSLRRELAEYLLYDITSVEAIPNVAQGELFQRGDIILNK